MDITDNCKENFFMFAVWWYSISRYGNASLWPGKDTYSRIVELEWCKNFSFAFVSFYFAPKARLFRDSSLCFVRLSWSKNHRPTYH